MTIATISQPLGLSADELQQLTRASLAGIRVNNAWYHPLSQRDKTASLALVKRGYLTQITDPETNGMLVVCLKRADKQKYDRDLNRAEAALL